MFYNLLYCIVSREKLHTLRNTFLFKKLNEIFLPQTERLGTLEYIYTHTHTYKKNSLAHIKYIYICIYRYRYINIYILKKTIGEKN